MNLKDIKIKLQVRLAMGVIMTSVLLLAALAWYHADSIWHSTSGLYDHPLKTRLALSEISANVLSIRVNIRDYLLIEDKHTRQNLLNEMAVRQSNVLREVEKLKLCYLGPKTDIEVFNQEFVKWVSIRNESIRIVISGNLAEARKRHEPGGIAPVQAVKVLGSLKEISDFAQNKGDEFYELAEKNKEALQNRLLITVIIIFAISLSIMYFLIRGIVSPVNELSRTTSSYRQGKLESRSSFQSENELGQLSASFNNLADLIETDFILNEKASKLAGIMLSEDDAREFCHALLTSLLEYTDSQMGAVFLLNKGKTDFEHFESIGLNSEGMKPISATNYEGEFGNTLATRKIQHITQLPKDHRFVFTTVSGAIVPGEIITIPIVSGNETLAIISLANINHFSSNSIRLLNTIHSTLCARMDGILSYNQVIIFSQQLENQNKELESQKKELSAQANELSKQNAELEMQKQQLDEVNKLKTSFLSNMSHELRTPLNSVIALSGVLSRRLTGKVPEEEHSYLDVIERNGKHLLLLINDILDLSRIEAGREEIDITNFNLKVLINEIVEMIEPQAKQKNIYLDYVSGDTELIIQSDFEKCRHILQNIVANAVKFTDEGGVTITSVISETTIKIEVADTGIGIDKKFLPFIFDEFRQADDTNSRKNSGTGLGLAIAKKYAEMLGGNIYVDSARGVGSKFVFSLSAQIDDSMAVSDSNESFSGKASAEMKTKISQLITQDKTILLVEDSEAIIIQMKDMLLQQGYKIMVARNGNEAMEQIAHTIPDAMILDLMMPELDGFEVLKRIRTQKATERLPVIILTAKYISKEELAFLKHNGIHQLIQKGGINKEQLLEQVAQMMFPKILNQEASLKKPLSQTITGKPLVLVIEDNPDNMLTIKALLAGSCNIIGADNGLYGVEMARKHQPHLILMDIALPGMNGIDALAEIRQDSLLKNIPVIAISASAMKGDREDFIAYGFDNYISKPIDHEWFMKVMNDFIPL
jgi:signal transduction histidine kinase/response regulator RpfG family c-di-GMP phosphodiesterase